MNAKDAVAIRIRELCKEKNITVNALSYRSGVTASTIYSMLNGKSQNPGVVSIEKICVGFEIPFKVFFSGSVFDEMEQESEYALHI